MNMSLNELFSAILKNTQIDASETCIQKTTGTQVINAATLYPENEEDIIQILEICNKHQLKIMPLSTGKNWGYTDGAPLNDRAITINMSRMNKIVAYNKESSFITLQSGVTQEQLSKYLQEHGDQHIASVTGSRPDTSIIGNYLERGFGITPFCDHAHAVTDIKVILPDGTPHRKSLHNLHCDQIAKAYNHDLGPNFTDIFMQSNLGIVTEMSFALANKPETTLICVIEATKDQLPAFFTSISKLQKEWQIHGFCIKLLNQAGSLSSGQVKLPPNYEDTDLEARAKKNKIAPYTFLLINSGSKNMMKALHKDIKKSLSSPCIRRRIINQNTYKIATLTRSLMPDKMRKKIDALNMLWNYSKGIPIDKNIDLAYWGHQGNLEKNTKDPAADGCGIIWYAALIPLSYNEYSKIESNVKDICAQYKFHPVVNLTSYSPQYAIALTPILYNRQTEALKAQECYRELLKTNLNSGFPPYRLPDFAMEYMDFPETHLAKKIKKILDPNNIIAPGKYGI